jgi:hypothetical protein
MSYGFAQLVPIATLAIQVSSIILEQYSSVLRYFSFNQNAKINGGG